MIKSLYKTVFKPKHWTANSSGCVYEHVYVAERALGGPLPKGARVHHVDHNRHNNAPRNLVICEDEAYHQLLHHRERVLKAGGDPNTQKICSFCRLVLPLDAFHRMQSNRSTGRQSACIECNRKFNAGRARSRPKKAA